MEAFWRGVGITERVARRRSKMMRRCLISTVSVEGHVCLLSVIGERDPSHSYQLSLHDVVG